MVMVKDPNRLAVASRPLSEVTRCEEHCRTGSSRPRTADGWGRHGSTWCSPGGCDLLRCAVSVVGCNKDFFCKMTSNRSTGIYSVYLRGGIILWSCCFSCICDVFVCFIYRYICAYIQLHCIVYFLYWSRVVKIQKPVNQRNWVVSGLCMESAERYGIQTPGLPVWRQLTIRCAPNCLLCTL